MWIAETKTVKNKLNNKMNQLFSSHPELPARIKKMEERAKKDGYTE